MIAILKRSAVLIAQAVGLFLAAWLFAIGVCLL